MTEARFALSEPSFINHRRRSRGKRAAGLAYEKKAKAYLETLTPHFHPGPWLQFRSADNRAWRWCQPDGLIVDLPQGLITIVEIKLQHTSDAWWQVRQLYAPVLRALFGSDLFDFAALEVVKWFDPATRFPEHFERVPDPLSFASRDAFGVHIYSGR